MWTVIEGERGDLTDEPMPNVGSLVLNFSQCVHDLNVCLFLNAASNMINEDTLIGVLLRSSSRKSSGIIHDKIEMSSFSLIILECAITVTMDEKTTIEGPVLCE